MSLSRINLLQSGFKQMYLHGENFWINKGGEIYSISKSMFLEAKPPKGNFRNPYVTIVKYSEEGKRSVINADLLGLINTYFLNIQGSLRTQLELIDPDLPIHADNIHSVPRLSIVTSRPKDTDEPFMNWNNDALYC